jgi:glyoxylate reductase
MPTRKPTVIVTRKLPDVVETRMRELFATTLNDTDEPMSQSQLVDAVKKAEVLVPPSRTGSTSQSSCRLATSSS